MSNFAEFSGPAELEKSLAYWFSQFVSVIAHASIS